MSLYNIELELLELFAHIEENDGEITEEMYAQLNITKENLYAKLGNYVKAIKSWNGDVTIVKEEVKKLQANAKVKENRVERLKKAMLNAVLLFGNDGKSGNKVIDLPTVKLFTKGTTSTETDDIRISKLIAEFERFVRELVDNDILYTGSDVELKGILDVINANLKAEYESVNVENYGVIGLDATDQFIPYTLTDLTTLKIEITTTRSIYDLFRTGKDVLTMYGNNPIICSMRNHTAKEDWKTAIEVANNINSTLDDSIQLNVKVSYPTVAKLVKNQSIQIK